MKLTRGVLVALSAVALALTGCDSEERDFSDDGDAGAETEESDTGETTEETDAETTDEATDGATDEATDVATDEATDAETDVATDAETDVGEEPDGGVDETDVQPEPDGGMEEPPVAACEVDDDCDDGNVCNGVEICEGGECLSGQNADDGDVCEIDGVDDLLLCINGNCTPTSCGDGIIDDRTDEQCDDGNDADGDGCEVGCTYSCGEDADCDDGNVCNGAEVCDPERHVCGAGTTADDGTECDTDRACFEGRCIGLGCGNDVLEDGEDCDDGNSEDGDGCDADCTFTCVEDTDCNDGNVCNGEETCDTDTNTCIAGEDLACEDGNACTENLCDPESGCAFPLIDVDGDGHAAADLGACGDDCNDDDPDIYEGANELCDEKDNDCDGDVDEEAPVWYVDCDGDRFALSSAASIQQCDMPETAPTGCADGSAATWTSTAPAKGQADCYDVATFVRPRLNTTDNNAAWSSTEYAGRPAGRRYDHNCDGTEEVEIKTTGVTSESYCDEDPQIFIPIVTLGVSQILIPLDPVKCYGSSGWSGGTAPGCGVEAAYSTCSGLSGSCARYQGTRIQRCR